MITSDFLLSIASIIYVVCAVPQLIRNLRFRDTLTQSIMTNSLILIATSISLFAYLIMNLYYASVFLIVELIMTVILIIQIIIWRKHRRSKKIKKVVEKTENVRSFIRSIKGVR